MTKAMNPLDKKKEVIEQSFDIELWHAMNERDNALIRDEIINGHTAKKFVYSFNVNGTPASGISVIGARELAAHYGGIKSKIVASTEKTGSLFIFKTFNPLDIRVQKIPELESEPDFYEVIMEISDIKTGNSQEHMKKENKTAYTKDRKPYDRLHYDVIAQSKAFRNGVNSILPQSITEEFKRRALEAGNGEEVKTIDDYRKGIIAKATQYALSIDRKAVENLTYAEISGLGQALKDGLDTFKQAAESLGIINQHEVIDVEATNVTKSEPTTKPTYDKGK